RFYTRPVVRPDAIAYLVADLPLLPAYPLLIRMFSAPQELIWGIFLVTLVGGIFQPLCWAQSFIIPSALRAAGDAKYTSIVALITMWTVRVVLGYVLGVVLKMEILGVFLAMEIEWGIRAIIFSRRLKGNKWYAHKLI
ncbi:MAG: MATE family efflux transporter, partial [Eubacteriales bacterium]|nr:MATE family efflux transporter [Eubacteriales bacterium]